MTEQRPLASRVLSGSLILVLTQVVGFGLLFLAQRIILSTLTKEENGELFVYRRIADIIVITLCDAGLNSVAMRMMARKPDRADEVIASVAVFRIVMGVIGTIIAMSVALVSGYTALGVGLWAIYVMISTRTGLLRYTLETPLRMDVRFGFVSLFSVLDAVLFLLAIWVVRDGLDAQTIIVAFLLSVLPSFLFLLWMDRGRHFRPSLASRSMTIELLREATPVIVSVLLLNIHDKVDAFLLKWFSTPTEVGVFSAAYQSLAPLVNTMPIAAVMAIVPVVAKLAQEDEVRSRAYALTGLRLLGTVGIGVATVTSMLTPIIIHVVSNGRYADNEPQFFAFLWMTFPIFLLFYVQELNIALGAQRKNIRITGVLAVGTVAAGLVLIPWYDSMGAIVAKFIAVGTGAAVAVGLFFRILGKSLTLSTVGGAVGTAAACALASWLLPQLMPRPLAVICGVIVWGGMSAVVGLLRRSDVAHLRTVFKRNAG
ncbi:MAG: hypothetical protein FGM24_05365 [Candidatus Kapabacteria bacterium]|nr:hypothetical protein [Candidatus Kapabacteria bacterium]